MERKGRAISQRILWICLITALIGFSLFLFYRRNQADQMARLELLEDRVQRMDQLVSARQTYREVIYTEKKLLLADKRVLFSLVFTVEAGFRLENCRVEMQSGRGVLVYLPPVEILSIDADESSIKQYFAKEQLTPIRFSDYSQVIEEEKKQILFEARQSDLEKRAEANGVNTIKSIFRLAGVESVTVRFSDVLTLNSRGDS